MYTEEELEALSSNVIKGFLKDMGQKMSGTKKDLIARVLAWQAVPENEVRNVTEAFFLNISHPRRVPNPSFLSRQLQPRGSRRWLLLQHLQISLWKHWRPKFVIIMISLGLVNVHAIVKCGKGILHHE